MKRRRLDVITSKGMQREEAIRDCCVLVDDRVPLDRIVAAIAYAQYRELTNSDIDEPEDAA